MRLRNCDRRSQIWTHREQLAPTILACAGAKPANKSQATSINAATDPLELKLLHAALVELLLWCAPTQMDSIAVSTTTGDVGPPTVASARAGDMMSSRRPKGSDRKRPPKTLRSIYLQVAAAHGHTGAAPSAATTSIPSSSAGLKTEVRKQRRAASNIECVALTSRATEQNSAESRRRGDTQKLKAPSAAGSAKEVTRRKRAAAVASAENWQQQVGLRKRPQPEPLAGAGATAAAEGGATDSAGAAAVGGEHVAEILHSFFRRLAINGPPPQPGQTAGSPSPRGRAKKFPSSCYLLLCDCLRGRANGLSSAQSQAVPIPGKLPQKFYDLVLQERTAEIVYQVHSTCPWVWIRTVRWYSKISVCCAVDEMKSALVYAFDDSAPGPPPLELQLHSGKSKGANKVQYFLKNKLIAAMAAHEGLHSAYVRRHDHKRQLLSSWARATVKGCLRIELYPWLTRHFENASPAGGTGSFVEKLGEKDPIAVKMGATGYNYVLRLLQRPTTSALNLVS